MGGWERVGLIPGRLEVGEVESWLERAGWSATAEAWGWGERMFMLGAEGWGVCVAMAPSVTGREEKGQGSHRVMRRDWRRSFLREGRGGCADVGSVWNRRPGLLPVEGAGRSLQLSLTHVLLGAPNSSNREAMALSSRMVTLQGGRFKEGAAPSASAAHSGAAQSSRTPRQRQRSQSACHQQHICCACTHACTRGSCFTRARLLVQLSALAFAFGFFFATRHSPMCAHVERLDAPVPACCLCLCFCTPYSLCIGATGGRF